MLRQIGIVDLYVAQHHPYLATVGKTRLRCDKSAIQRSRGQGSNRLDRLSWPRSARLNSQTGDFFRSAIFSCSTVLIDDRIRFEPCRKAPDAGFSGDPFDSVFDDLTTIRFASRTLSSKPLDTSRSLRESHVGTAFPRAAPRRGSHVSCRARLAVVVTNITAARSVDCTTGDLLMD